MKKAIKKLMAALLAVAMLCAMAVPAFAAEVTNSNVSITNHDFEAYQIFAGKYEDGKLTNIVWGDGVDADKLLTALKTNSLYSACKDAADVAKVLENNNNDAVAQEFANVVAENLSDVKTSGKGSVALPAAGYYLIKDVTTVEGKDDALNKTLLKVDGAETVTPKVKTDKPTVEKKVKDTNDTTGTTTGWQDSADYDIGDTIPYQLTATMGDLSNYNTYSIEFVDTMTHLTFSGIKYVKVGDKELVAGEYTYNWNEESKILTVSIADVKALGAVKGTKVVVEYEATLDADAAIGAAGNPNEVYLKYSNNPNGSGEGKTAPDKNIVFTYKVNANKVDQDGNALMGAAFELFKKVGGDWVSKGVQNATYDANTGKYTLIENSTATTFEWSGLDDGTYKLVEVVTPTGYNSIADQIFEIKAEHDVESDDPKLTNLTGDAETGSTITFTPGVSNGELSTEIENRMGSTLPETGGIGTTIFYVVGGGLMVAAAILLITKKRMEKDN